MINRTTVDAIYDRLDPLIASFSSQAEFSKATGITPAQVSRWRNRLHLPRVTSLIAVCEAMSVSADWLLMGRGPKHHTGSGADHV